MDSNPIELLRERDFGQKINASFDFAVKNFKPLLTNFIKIVAPASILAGIASGFYQSRLLSGGNSSTELQSFSRIFSTEYLISIFFGIITYMLASMIVTAYMVLYERKGGRGEITTTEVWSLVMEKLGTVVVASLISMVLIVIAFCFLIIPGILLAISFQLYMMVIFRENRSAGDSLRRSYDLVKTRWWSTLGIVMIMSFIAGIISVVFQLPLMITTFMSALGAGDGGQSSKILLITSSIIAGVGTNIVQGIIWIAVGFQYYNLVEKTEGAGLRAEIETLGNSEKGRNTEEF